MKRVLWLIVFSLLVVNQAWALGPDVALGKFVKCDSAMGGAYIPKNLTDGSQNTSWFGTKLPDTCTIDLGTVKNITYLRLLYPANEAISNASVNVKVEVSTNNASYVAVAGNNGSTSFFGPNWVANFPIRFSARYIKLTFNEYHIKFKDGMQYKQVGGQLGELTVHEY